MTTPPPPTPPVPPPAAGAPKSRIVAGILGILLGGLGIHNFYLGYNKKAVIQIIVTFVTCGIGSIWGLVEGILILVKNPSYLTDANGVPLTD
jgi:TM2 domain-containing membrane protein YozV